MSKDKTETFIIDCPVCKAKVAAIREAVVQRVGEHVDPDEFSQGHYGYKLYSGKCPRCDGILAGVSEQIAFADKNDSYDAWSDIVRVYPQPARVFTSRRIPQTVKLSLAEGDRCLDMGAPTAACVMFGRALEAICQDQITRTAPAPSEPAKGKSKHGPMLGQGIEILAKRGVIETRFLEWSKNLQAFRNMAAHPNEFVISDNDAEDLQGFMHAFTEYIYDLADRYEDFMDRFSFRRKTTKK